MQPSESQTDRSESGHRFESASIPAALALLAAMAPSAIEGQEPRKHEPISPPAVVRNDQTIEDLATAQLPPVPEGFARPDLEPVHRPAGEPAADTAPAAAEREIRIPPPENIYEWLKQGAILGLGVAAAISAIRGTAKVYQYFKENWDARKRFNHGIWFDSLACNLHTLSDENGKLVLNVYTFASPTVSSFIPNKYAEKRFRDAADSCSEHQPFPSLHFPLDPGSSRIEGLNRMNRFFKEGFSSIFQEDIMAAGLGLPTQRGTFFIIPTCEVFARGGKNYRALAVTVISEDTFERFGSGTEILRMQGATREDDARIRNLQLAYIKHNDYKRQNGPDAELFPKVTVVIKK